MKRVVWLPNWIGDAVMATPALRLIRQQFPDDSLVGIYRGPIRATLASTRLLTQMIEDRSGGKRSLREKMKFVQELRAERFDEIVLLTNSLRTAAIARLAKIPRRIGFARDGRSWLLTERVAPQSRAEPNPVLDEYLRLAGRLAGVQDLTQVNRQLELRTSAEDRRLWDDYATRHSLDEGQYYCLNSGGAFGAAKNWPMGSFVKLAHRIVKRFQRPVVMICGPAEREFAREFQQQAAHPWVHSLAEEPLSVGLSQVMVEKSRLMVTTDSGPRQFAAAFGVPVVALFGPTHIAWSDNYFPHEIRLQEKVDCGPCQQRTCPLGHHRCMTDLSPERVFAAVCHLEMRRQEAQVA